MVKRMTFNHSHKGSSPLDLKGISGIFKKIIFWITGSILVDSKDTDINFIFFTMNLSLILFTIGILGFGLNRKNIILMLISTEIIPISLMVEQDFPNFLIWVRVLDREKSYLL
jgi:hypothetical protein